MNIQPHTSFIQALRPLYYVSKAIGMAPFSIINECLETDEEKFVSAFFNTSSIIWSVIVFLCLLANVIYSITRVLLIRITMPGEFVLEFLNMPLVYITALISVLAIICKRETIFQLLRKAYNIDRRLFTKEDLGISYKKIRLNSIYILTVVSIFCTIFFTHEVIFWRNRISCIYEATARIADWVGIVMVFQYCSAVIFIKLRMKALNRKFSALLNKDSGSGVQIARTNKVLSSNRTELSTIHNITDSKIFPQVLEKPLESQLLHECREIYNLIYVFCRTVNWIYGFPILLELTSIFISYVNIIYATVNLVRRNFSIKTQAPSLLGWNIYSSFKELAITFLCETAVNESRRLLDEVHEMLLKRDLSDEMRSELQLFSLQLKHNKIQFSAAGLFVVGSSQFCSFVTGVTTYIVILIQFSK
ncbi:hypothetical protein ANN_13297 [Periplaneta americana]|uniref:Gustatory receptor n=1 Tax=Periplaneta americana TaxID=6978 RepID=A0ABQ8TLB7_PERAM|nr:hypothetical protein ANN_13297 [Periplaneta americana]